MEWPGSKALTTVNINYIIFTMYSLIVGDPKDQGGILLYIVFFLPLQLS